MTSQARSGQIKQSLYSQGSIIYLTFVCIVSAMGGLLFGFDTVVINGTIIQVTDQFQLSDALKGTFVSSALLGCVLGAGLAGTLSDRYGRKWVLIISSFFLLVSALGCGVAWSAWSLIFFRWIGGVGVGIASMICPLYISEISPPHLRGRMVTLFQFAITIGICVALFTNAGLQYLADTGKDVVGPGWYRLMVVDEVWRAMFTSEAITGVLFLLLCFVIPETPRYLAMTGQMDQARKVLSRIGGSVLADKQIIEIQEAISQETGSLGQLFQKALRKPLFVALFLAIVSEMSGITVVFYYGTEILNNGGVKISEALGGFVVIGLVNVVFTLIAIWLMDRAGRRPLLFLGTLGAFFSLMTIGFLFATGNTSGMILVTMICSFVAFFAFSMGPIKWVVMSEIFPTRIRGRAVAIATLAVWVTDTVYNFLFPLVEPHLGTSGSFFIFALVLLPQLLFVWKIMPETKGRTLEEIELSWLKH
jgi:sugar porter (SP) family MFS transporter